MCSVMMKGSGQIFHVEPASDMEARSVDLMVAIIKTERLPMGV